MIEFQANIDDNGDQQTINEVVDVINTEAIPAIKAKAQELAMLVSVDVNISVNLSPRVE